jgi:signal transduction protein with GAF and PtsI domain
MWKSIKYKSGKTGLVGQPDICFKIMEVFFVMDTESKVNIKTFKKAVGIICEAASLDVMANDLVQFLYADMALKGSAVFFYNAEFKELEALAAFGLSSSYLTKGIITVDKSFLSANLEGKISVCADLSSATSLQYPEKAKEEGIASIISVPIISLGEFLGVLRFYHGEAWTPSEEDLNSLSILGYCMGIAMTNNRLLNATLSISELLDNVLPGRQ